MPKPINYLLGYINSIVVDVIKKYKLKIKIACGAFHSVCVISGQNTTYSKSDVIIF